MREDARRAPEALKNQSPVLKELGMSHSVLEGSEESYVQLRDQSFLLMSSREDVLGGKSSPFCRVDSQAPRVGSFTPV